MCLCVKLALRIPTHTHTHIYWNCNVKCRDDPEASGTAGALGPQLICIYFILREQSWSRHKPTRSHTYVDAGWDIPCRAHYLTAINCDKAPLNYCVFKQRKAEENAHSLLPRPHSLWPPIYLARQPGSPNSSNGGGGGSLPYPPLIIFNQINERKTWCCFSCPAALPYTNTHMRKIILRTLRCRRWHQMPCCIFDYS